MTLQEHGTKPHRETPAAPPGAGDAPPAALRVLLWSTKGAGQHYGGPGMSAWRMYSKAAPGRFCVTLAHGFAKQEDYPAFAEAHLVAPYATDLLSQLRFIRAGRRWVAANADRFDVMHGLQGFEPTMAAAVEAERRGLPAVVKLAAHRADFADKRNWRTWLGVQRRRRRKAMRLAGIIAISREIEQELLGYGFPRERIARIPNGVDAQQFRPVSSETDRGSLREQLGWPDRPTILFVGGLVRRKRPHLLIEALAELRRIGVEAQLALVGPPHEADYAEEMRQRARERGIEHAITWQGFTADVAAAYRAADIFALPSANEGLANAVLEAMASGLPAVVTPTSGMADLVGEGVTGYVTDPRPAALAEALGRVLSDSALARRLGDQARHVVLSRFSAEAVLDAHERLFRRVIAGGPAAE